MSFRVCQEVTLPKPNPNVVPKLTSHKKKCHEESQSKEIRIWTWLGLLGVIRWSQSVFYVKIRQPCDSISSQEPIFDHVSAQTAQRAPLSMYSSTSSKMDLSHVFSSMFPLSQKQKSQRRKVCKRQWLSVFAKISQWEGLNRGFGTNQ